MESFKRLSTSDGERVSCSRVVVQSTFYGVLEGSDERISQRIRDDFAQKRGVDGKDPAGTLVLDPGTKVLPSSHIIAELLGPPMDDRFDLSTLTLNWFIEGPIGDLEERVRSQVASLTWREHAVNFNC